MRTRRRCARCKRCSRRSSRRRRSPRRTWQRSKNAAAALPRRLRLRGRDERRPWSLGGASVAGAQERASSLGARAGLAVFRLRAATPRPSRPKENRAPRAGGRFCCSANRRDMPSLRSTYRLRFCAALAAEATVVRSRAVASPFARGLSFCSLFRASRCKSRAPRGTGFALWGPRAQLRMLACFKSGQRMGP